AGGMAGAGDRAGGAVPAGGGGGVSGQGGDDAVEGALAAWLDGIGLPASRAGAAKAKRAWPSTSRKG
ncbi:hypothetical protein DWU95_38455, partial [Burkholderia contaminans]